MAWLAWPAWHHWLACRASPARPEMLGPTASQHLSLFLSLHIRLMGSKNTSEANRHWDVFYQMLSVSFVSRTRGHHWLASAGQAPCSIGLELNGVRKTHASTKTQKGNTLSIDALHKITDFQTRPYFIFNNKQNIGLPAGPPRTPTRGPRSPSRDQDPTRGCRPHPDRP